MEARRHLHGTTVVMVQNKNQIALAADSLTVAGDDYPFDRSSRKIHSLIQDVYIGLAGWVSVETEFLHIIRKIVSDVKEDLGTDDWREPLRRWWGALRKLNVTGGESEGLAKAFLNIEEEGFALGIIVSPRGAYEFWSCGGFYQLKNQVYAIGSGGNFAEGAARALLKAGWKDPRKIAITAVKIAAKCCLTANARPKVVVVKRD